ncbi:hypothetical protein ES703_10550 [subsurface metagenome]
MNKKILDKWIGSFWLGVFGALIVIFMGVLTKTFLGNPTNIIVYLLIIIASLAIILYLLKNMYEMVKEFVKLN